MANEETVPKDLVKDLIKQLHEGQNPDEVKQKFRDLLKNIGPTQIAQVEQELVSEGMPQEEIRRLCDVHLEIFKDSLDQQKLELETDHPLYVFMEEHKIILQHVEELKEIIRKVTGARGFENVKTELERLKHIAQHLMEAENHNMREENVLFPYLEKHGITEPPAIMWAEHNELKERKKRLLDLLATSDQLTFPEFVKQLKEVGRYISEELANHIYKENHILYPAALRTIQDAEWREVREQCDELGYCCFTPSYVRSGESEAEKPALAEAIGFETGDLTREALEGLLNALPVDVTFVDASDTVRYFNKAEGRVFPRTKAVIGRKVQQCHPPKSIHIVDRVLGELKNMKRKSADFWINMNERIIYIRYFPVRNHKGEFLGVIEVTQDITDIQRITGERRLLSEVASE
jgi:PAS domain S-box-containing protein